MSAAAPKPNPTMDPELAALLVEPLATEQRRPLRRPLRRARPVTRRNVAVVVAALFVAFIVVANLLPHRTDGMTCEDLRVDNLRLSKVYPPTDESMEQTRANNARVAELGCAWASDDKAGPA